MAATYKVFVFGTLKRGQPNFYTLENPSYGTAVYEGEATTVELYPVVITSRCNIPFMLPVAGVGKLVAGEVFKVDEKMLKSLDDLERRGEVLDRSEIDVLFQGEILKCWCYHLVNHRKELLQLPMIENYDSNGSHGLPYIPNSLTTCNDFSDVQNK